MEPNLPLLQQKLTQSVNLPSLAKNIHLLLQALADDSLSYQQLADVIKHYPSITARLIFLANSPWSAPITPIINIEQACARLGPAVVKSISIATAISSAFDTRKCSLFNPIQLWTSAMLVSQGAGLLAEKVSGHIIYDELEATAQTAGLLYNLGLLWLADNLPTETGNALQLQIDNPLIFSVNDSLKQCIGTDYCEIGGWIAKQIRLPEVLTIAIQKQQDDMYQASSWEITLLVGAAAQMVAALYKQDNIAPNDHRLSLLGVEAGIHKEVFQQLGDNFDKTQELARTLFT